jgi:hypothetical protein
VKNQTTRIVIGVIAIIVGLARLYQSIYDRPAGGSVSRFGIVVGLSFVAMGAMFCFRRARQR